ncbi:PAS domain S-box-containing protein [Clostridium punense]|uniref:Stage 0 sporulation protein A homolog n=1 Tax=Clostridium punense TaxID=1054297 RepID=A0ABS4K0B6_9CLOT|nr:MULTISPECIES: PAS domain S-box protein [Clostridium]EQB86430.1 hypothetical protein M918_14280 [Clostridium sp. BL8]MBP2021234.1 PAS domain S-box-containing protein [Clostridium punense]
MERLNIFCESSKKQYCKFVEIIDNMSEAILIYDHQGVINFANSRCRDFFGFTPEEMIDTTVLDYVHTEDIEKVKESIKHRLKYGSEVVSEVAIVHKKGEIRHCRFKGKAIKKDENIIGIIVIGEDITGKKVGEKKLKESEEKYKALFNNTMDAILAQELPDGESLGKFIEVNEEAISLWGYSREELLSMSPLDLEGVKNMPDAKKMIDGVLSDTCRTFHRITYAKDGSKVPVEVKKHIFYLQGKKVLLSTVRDCRERKKSEEDLNKSIHKYQALFKNMVDAFAYSKILFDSENKAVDSIILEANEMFRNMMDIKSEDFIGKRASQFHNNLENKNNDWLQLCGKVALTGESIKVNEVYFSRLNKWFSISLYTPEKGYCATMFSDITKIKESQEVLQKAKEAAEEANRAKSSFLANMSHEIRTPLNGIMGLIDLTLHSQLDEDQKENLDLIKKSADSLLSIINDVLDFSKIEAGKLLMRTVDFNLRELIENIIKVHRVNAKEKGVALSYCFRNKVPLNLKGDSSRIQQILNNLIGNAVKFTETGKISVNIRNTSKSNDNVELEFEVLDTGIGISKEDMSKLFKDFSQIDSSITRKHGGTGLGLIITKRLVEIMNGTIGVESQVGVGTSFHFTIKLQVSQAGLKEEKCKDINLINDKILKVLLVEDDKTNQLVTKMMLQRLGHQVTTANNGVEAINVLKEQSFDVILMDIQMPEMDGAEATSIIRSKGKDLNSNIPIIALTAHALEGDREKFIAMGADSYIPKPVSIGTLYETLDKVIYGKKSNTNCGKKEDLESFNYSFNTMKEYSKNLRSALQLENLPLVERNAHDIKEVSQKLGKANIKTLAFRLQLAARRGDLEEVKKLYYELEKALIM